MQKGYNNIVQNENSVAHNFGYNGKENNPELGLDWLDFRARNYDPAIGRWMNLDAKAELFQSWTPYKYAFNNPVIFNDQDGNCEWCKCKLPLKPNCLNVEY